MAEIDASSYLDTPSPNHKIHQNHTDHNIDHGLLVEAESYKADKIISCVGSHTIKSSLHENEDRCSESHHDDFYVFTVADGHDGADASSFAIDNLSWNILRSQESDSNNQYTIDHALRQAFITTDDQFCKSARRSGSTSGTCVIALVVRGRHAAFASSGDCGAVFHNHDGTYKFICKRHTAKDQSEADRIRSAGGFIQGDRVMGILCPSRGFGDIDVRDSCPGSIIPNPDVVSLIISQSDNSDPVNPIFALLASDGVFDTVDLNTAVSLVKKTLILHANQAKRAELAARKLVRYCADRTTDDITAIVICFR